MVGWGGGQNRAEPRWGGARDWVGRDRSLNGAGPESGWGGKPKSSSSLQEKTHLAPVGPESLDSAREEGGLEAGCGWAGGTLAWLLSECGLRDS